MTPGRFEREKSWRRKFAGALSGLQKGVRGEGSFFVHFFATAAVFAVALIAGVDHFDWCLLALCIGGVLAAEMFNSAIERLARALEDEYNADLGEALDVASAAVLIAALTAAVVGLVVLGRSLGELFGRW
jgi:diacylglycerol kinase